MIETTITATKPQTVRLYEFRTVRVKNIVSLPSLKITNSEDAVTIIQEIYERDRDHVREHALLLHMDVRSHTIGYTHISTGTYNNTFLDPKFILQSLLLAGATKFIVVHNHPSGDTTPSAADLKITTKLAKASKYHDFVFLDHLIINDSYEYYSIAAEYNRLFNR